MAKRMPSATQTTEFAPSSPSGADIVVVGDSQREDLCTRIVAAGFSNVAPAESLMFGDTPQIPALIVVVGADAPTLCAEARRVPILADVPILAVVAAIPPSLPAAAMAGGATDVASESDPNVILGARVRSLLRGAQARDRTRELEANNNALLQIRAALGSSDEDQEVFREVLLVTIETLEFDRASLVAYIEGSLQAYVVAATDDPTLSKFALSIDEYPEILRALDTAQPVLIHDAQTDPTMKVAHRVLRRKNIRGVAVLPVVWRGRPLGVILLRRRRRGVAHMTAAKLNFARLVTTLAAPQLRHGAIMESLRDQTHRISRARYEAERRLRMIDSLKDHFESAADGVVVLDSAGRILFLNHTAERITGFARDGLLGSSLVDLISEPQREGLGEVISSVLGGTNLEAFDLDLSTTSGQPICVSVTTSTVLSKSGAVILSFRDVTAERALELELRQTKEFLERLIDSTVDAIVAADTRGNIILFNQGAERIYGYVAQDVLGRLPVWKLYPEGVAKQIMRMLRSSSYGGVGRLEQIRREVITSSGERIPVNLTASIVYQEGEPIATVGIFSDLRDHIQMEQRLLQAQERLQRSQKQAVIAELAGAAAHELNQPLTSILGYAQLIERQSDPDDQHWRPNQVILQEGERMAEIVKKIGRITKFETKQYVGSANILDLDRASDSPLASPTESMDNHPTIEFTPIASDRAGYAGEPDTEDDLQDVVGYDSPDTEPHDTVDDLELASARSDSTQSESSGT